MIEATIAEKIQRIFSLGNKTIPLFGQILGVCSPEAKNELCLEGLNGLLLRFLLMNLGGTIWYLILFFRSACFKIDKALLSII